jgi:hypothetical protein
MPRRTTKLQITKATHTERIVRPELNLEQWPGIFAPSRAKGKKFQTRTLEKVSLAPDGLTVIGTIAVEVGFSQHGSLTTEEQLCLYGLVRIWEHRGKPPSFCYLSRYELAQELRKKWGTRAIETMNDSLRRLRTVPITFRHTFYNAEEEIEEEETSITILTELKLRSRRRKKDGTYQILSEEGFFSFHPLILKNLLKNYTRPVLLDTVLSLQTDFGQLLYTQVDRVLSAYDRFEKNTADLFRELGITGEKYRYPSTRKQNLEQPVKELLYKPLSNGGFIGRAAIEKTRDRKDYKVIFEKNMKPEAILPARGVDEPEALVIYFRQVFFRSSGSININKKELEHAGKLVEAYGFECAKFVIEFAHKEAPKTNFDIKAFGGVMQYAPAAAAQFNEWRERTRLAQRKEAREIHERDFAFIWWDSYVLPEIQSRKNSYPEQYKEIQAIFVQCEKEHAHRLEQEREALKKLAVIDYISEHLELGILTFWDWDKKLNPNPFKEPDE